MSLVQWRGTQLLFAATESGALVASDRVRFTDVLWGPITLCYNSQPPRGAFGTFNFNGIGINRSGWVVNQSTVTPTRGTIGKLTIEWEAGGAYATAALPVGSFSLRSKELSPKIERNNFFRGILYTTIQAAYAALYAETQTGSGAAYNALQNISDSTQLALGQKLLTKLTNGEECYYEAGWTYTFEQFFYTAPAVNRGAVTGTPGGPLAGSLPGGVGWLRVADDLDPAGVAGSMYKITQNWIGAPAAFWDPDLY